MEMVMKYQVILGYQLFSMLFNFFKQKYIMEVGDKLNPQRSFRKGFALKGIYMTTYHKDEQSLYYRP